MYKVFFEAVVFGIISVILGLILSIIIKNFLPESNLPDECKDWNKYYVMEITLFLVGFFLRYTIEIPIINYLVTE